MSFWEKVFYSWYFLIPKAKGVRVTQAYFRSKAIAQIFEENKIPDGHSCFYYPFLRDGGLVCCFWLKGCLLSCGNSSQPSKVPQIHGQQFPLPVHSSPLQLDCSPLRIYEMYGSSVSFPVQIRNPCVPYLDDWLVRGLIQTSAILEHNLYPVSFSHGRAPNQYGKIYPDTSAENSGLLGWC